MEHFVKFIGLLCPYPNECDYRYYISLEDGSGILLGDDPYQKFSATFPFTPKHGSNHRPGVRVRLEDLPIKVWAVLIIIIRSRHMQYRAYKKEVMKRTLNVILKRIDKLPGIRHIDFYGGISEMGYQDLPMFCSNWNPDKASRFYNWAERFFDGKVEFDWYDEWTRCTECGRAVRISPDSYGWVPSYLQDDCDLWCHECVKEWPEDWVEDSYMNNSNRALLDWFPNQVLENMGFHCFGDDDYCNRYETGWHPGQTDDPTGVVKHLKEVIPHPFDYVFQISDKGQFDLKWHVWIRKKM